MKKPTHASVTAKPCKCGYLDKAAKNTDNPIEFDPSTNGYYFHYEIKGGIGNLNIYHCPFCGGVAPATLKNDHFETISDSESRRLFELVKNIKTLNDAYSQLGKPDEVREGIGRGHNTTESNPQIAERGRALVYKKLSEVAYILIEDYFKERVHISLESKPKGNENAG